MINVKHLLVILDQFFRVDAAAVCRNAPPAPFCKAATALPIAAMLVFSSLDKVANSAASFSRMAVASSMAEGSSESLVSASAMPAAEFLLSLAFSLNFRLHCLQQGHNFPDGVGPAEGDDTCENKITTQRT